MMTRITAATMAALLSACGSASLSEQQANAQGKAASKPLAIAEVTIGMPASKAEDALKRGGWTLRTFPGRDWETTVAEEKARQRGASAPERSGQAIETIEASKGDEKMIVDLRPVPSGSEVRFVKYEAPMAGRSAEALRAQLAGRYGAAAKASPAGAPLVMTWCSGGERCRSVTGAAQPALEAQEDVYHKLRLFLSAGSVRDGAWRTSVQRAAGGSSASSF